MDVRVVRRKRVESRGSGRVVRPRSWWGRVGRGDGPWVWGCKVAMRRSQMKEALNGVSRG